MEPINYLAQVADPFAQATQGLQLGAGMVELQQKQAAMVQQQQRQQLAAQEQARFFSNPNPTMRDAARYASLLSPEQANAFRPFMEGITKEQQQGALKSTGQLLSALQANPQTGIRLLRERAVAAENSGDKDDANLFNRLAEAAIADPVQGTQTAFKALVQSAAGIPGAKEFFETINTGLSSARAEAKAPSELMEAKAKADLAVQNAANAVLTAEDDIAKARAERLLKEAEASAKGVEARYAEQAAKDAIKKRAADLGLTAAQTNQALATTRKLGTETQKIALELEGLKATGGLDPVKSFEQEEKLRKEFQTRTKVYGELGTTYNNIKSSSEAKNGPGDIALITGFMKMLDPGSVVRETEFATARDTAGLYERLLNTSQKLQSGQLFALDSKQRQEYVNLAKQYLDSAQKKAGEDKKALGVVVKNYRLNPENVFGPEDVGGGAGRGSVNPPTPQQRNVTVNY
jgi:hypothetical protein